MGFFFVFIWDACRQRARIEMPFDEGFLCLLLPVCFQMMNGDSMLAPPVVVKSLGQVVFLIVVLDVYAIDDSVLHVEFEGTMLGAVLGLLVFLVFLGGI